MRELRHSTDHRQHRGAAYPELGEAADVLVALIRSLADAGLPVPPKAIAYADACDRIKADYPRIPDGR